MRYLTVRDLCLWFQVDIDTLRDIACNRSATQFPPSCKIDGELCYLESDVVAWVAWLDECREYDDSIGLCAEDVPAPQYATQGTRRATIPPTEEQE